MRVNFAAQVLSKSVGDGLETFRYAQATRNLIYLVDTFFDCLNVTSKLVGQMKCKHSLKPYYDENDWRFQWLEDIFLGYINQWEAEVQNFEDVPVEIKSRYCLSYQSLEALRTTVHTFVDLAKLSLHEYRVVYLLSEKFNQDTLEEHFCQDRAGGVENPNVAAYMYNEKKIILAKSEMLNVVRGNTRGKIKEKREIDINHQIKLPKRKKKIIT